MNESASQNSSNNAPVCVISGGTSGIGLATALLFSKQGYKIATCGRHQSRLDSARDLIDANRRGPEPLIVKVDLNQPSEAREFAEWVVSECGRLDVLVNNASFAPLQQFEEIDDASFEQVVNVNIRSVFQLTQSAWNQMSRQGRGVVVNISSMAAVDPFPGFSLYGSSKAWIELLTVALAAEGSQKGIRVCSIRPGAVETPLLRSLFPDFPADQCVSPEWVADRIWRCVSDPENHESGKIFTVTNQV